MTAPSQFTSFLRRHAELGPAEIERLSRIKTQQVSYRGGEVIIPMQSRLPQSCILVSGLALRVHPAEVLNRSRVITAIHVPGDFVDLHGFLLSGLGHDVVASGHAAVEFVSHDELREITRTHPRLTRLLMMCTAIDAAVNRQWLAAAASLHSTGHLAHLLCEIYTRLEQSEAATDRRMTLPLLQRDLADMLGYSTVHVNRAVRDLRDAGLVRWQGQHIEILDWDGMVKLSRFSPKYLSLNAHSR